MITYFTVLLTWSPELLHVMGPEKWVAPINSSTDKKLVLYFHKTLGYVIVKAHSLFCPVLVNKKTCDLVQWYSKEKPV